MMTLFKGWGQRRSDVEHLHPAANDFWTEEGVYATELLVSS